MTEQEKREKVIKGLECCILDGWETCHNCPYYCGNCHECTTRMKSDALALLKAQESEAVDAPKPDSNIGCWYDITHNYTLEQVVNALKEQEPRVMSVDEVQEWVRKQRVDREPICVEVKYNICAWIVSDEYWDLSMDVDLSGDLYDKTWRCWTSRPDQATREAKPWE